ncbi:MAG: hypothetical protein ACFFDP_07930 [Promethearchaeota archaeon]
MIDRRVADFFQFWREQYRWPLRRSRVETEKRILKFAENAKAAVASGKVEKLTSILLQIHRWKTRNQAGITDKYARQLDKEPKRIRELQKLLPITIETQDAILKKALDLMRFPDCNLPVCTAQLSFLSERVFPILDRFLAQFFSRKAHPMILQWAEYDILNVFETMGKINFILEDDGHNKGVPRLAVYTETSYRYNRDQYVDHLIPRLQHLAAELRKADMTYQGIDRDQHHFTSVDLQMAIFIFGKKNTRLFKQFYKTPPIPNLTIQIHVQKSEINPRADDASL